MLTVQITDMANGGAGIARVDGKVLFVTGAIEGDIAEVRVSVDKKSFAKADLVRLVTPSPYRRPPPCVAATECGGCPFIEALPSRQRLWKKDFALSSLAKLTGIGMERLSALAGEVHFGALPNGEQQRDGLGYRHRVTLKVGVQQSPAGPKLALGFLGRRSHRIAPISTCPVATPALQTVITGLAQAVAGTDIAKLKSPSKRPRLSSSSSSNKKRRGRGATGFFDLQLQEVIGQPTSVGEEHQVIATFMLGRRELTLGALLKTAPELRPLAAALKANPQVVWHGTSFDSKTAPAFVFDHSEEKGAIDYLTFPGLFQQAHLGTNRQMRAFVHEALDGCETVLDLFCGSGNLSLGLGSANVTGIESSPQSIAAASAAAKKAAAALKAAASAAAKKTAAAQKNTSHNYKAEAAQDYLREARSKAEAIPADKAPLFAGIVSDPPRAGHGELIADLIALKAPTLVLVGCDPMPHARDVAACLKGGYELKALRVFDAFPHTSHVETITVLGLTGG